jgi:hypothetical protein
MMQRGTPITEFPITMSVIVGGLERSKSLNKGDIVKCLRCGQKFHVSEKTAVMLNNGLPCLRCNNYVGEEERCGYTASVLYYFPEEKGPSCVNARHW